MFDKIVKQNPNLVFFSRLLSIVLLLVLISHVWQFNCAQAARPVISPANDSELPPWKLDVNQYLGVQGIEPPKSFTDNQLILHFSQLVKSGQIQEASKLLAEHKESLGDSKNAFLLQTVYLNVIRFSSVALVETLISSGLRPSTKTMRVSLLKYALWKRECAIADKLKASGFESDPYADVALGLVDSLKLALKDPAAIQMRDENGRTLMHWAALTGRSDLLELLVEAGASVDDDAKFGRVSEKPYYLSPLEVAISLGHCDACHILLANGANPNGRPGDIYRPLGIATKISSRRLVQSLVGAGAKVNAKDGEGRTALHIAALNNDQSLTEYLIKLGADTRVKDGEGKLPIELTDLQSVKFLLKPKKHFDGH
jgi:ankyrin repeat protein